MTDRDDVSENKNSQALTVILIVMTVLVVLGGILIIQATRDDEQNPESSSQTAPATPEPDQNIPAEPTNPNVTGGSSGAGTGTSNDPSAPTPSPAGGVDANNTIPPDTTPAQ